MFFIFICYFLQGCWKRFQGIPLHILHRVLVIFKFFLDVIYPFGLSFCYHILRQNYFVSFVFKLSFCLRAFSIYLWVEFFFRYFEMSCFVYIAKPCLGYLLSLPAFDYIFWFISSRYIVRLVCSIVLSFNPNTSLRVFLSFALPLT